MREYECEQNDERRDLRGVLAAFVVTFLALALMLVFTGCAKDDQTSAGDQAVGQQAAAAPLAADNLMYTLHFYAATHQQDLRDRLKSAVEGGLTVFVTEFGICDANGNGRIDYASADAWINLMDELDVSYICWNLSNKDEASALFKTSCTKTSGFTKDDLSEEGVWVWDLLYGKGANS